MSIDLHRLQVEITAEIKKFKKKCDEVKAEAKRTVSAANKDLGRIGDAGISTQVTTQLDAVRKQTQAIANQAKAFAKQAKIDAGLLEPTKEYAALSKNIQKAQSEVDKLKAKQEGLSDKDARVMTTGYVACADQIAKTKKRLDALVEQQIKWAELGESVTGSAAFQQVEKDIESANQELKKYQDRMAQMEASGRAFTPSEKFLGLQRQIQAAREQVKRYQAEQGQMSAAGTDYKPTSNAGGAGQTAKAYAAAGKRAVAGVAVEAAKVHPALQKTLALAQKFGNVSRKAFKGASTAVRGLTVPLRASVSWLKKLSSGFGTVYQRVRSLIPGLNRTRSSMDGLGQSCGKLLGRFGALRISATYMFASFLIMGSVNAMKEGFKSLSQYSAKTNSDLSMLMSSLIQLRNSLATAFAPILSVVAPILNTLIGWLTSATTAIAHFFAALTGQSKVVVAKKVNADFASSVADTGSAADDANKKAEKYKKTLLGFDQINKLDDPTSDSASGGAGASGGGLSPNDMFETVEVDNKWSNWADKVKEAWANADFTEIGAILSGKLNGALANIPWDGIKETARKIAQSIATFLNGFIETTDWGLIGNTLAQGINTAFEFLNSFAQSFHWDSLGSAIGSGINGALTGLDWNVINSACTGIASGIATTLNNLIETTNWKLIGTSFANAFNTIINTAYKFVTTFNWKKFGTAIGSAINGFVADLDLAKAGKTLSDAVKGILDTAINMVTTIDWSQIGQKIADFICNIDWIGVAKKIITLLGDAIVGAVDLLSGFIDRVGKYLVNYIKSGDIWKDLFGLAKITLEVGIKLVKAGWELLSTFIGTLVKVSIELIRSGWTALTSFIGDKLSVFVALIRNGWTALKDFVGDKVSVLVSRVKNWTTSISSWVGNKMTLFMSRKKNWTSSIASWVGSKITLLMSRKKNWTGSILSWVLNGAKSLLLKFSLPKIGVKWGEKTVAGFKIKYPSGFETYAKGGFPEEGPFLMNRGEIAGKFSNGKSVVANNQQITDGIAAAVYRAEMAVRANGTNADGMSAGELRALLSQVLTELKGLSFYIGDEEIARHASKGQELIDRRFNPVTG